MSDENLCPGEPPAEGLTVGRTAGLVGVSVKTLHHWDAIGLVRPGGRTRAGYRVYGDDDVARLHRVLVYREIGLPLAAIGRLLDDPEVDAREHLRRQRGQLAGRISRLERMVGAVDRMLLESKPGIRLTPEEQVEIFGADWEPTRTEEAEERWGGTAQWAQYAERAAAMDRDDWEGVAAAVEALSADLAAAYRTGVAPGSEAADALAERHRAQISTYFDCTYAMQVCIGRTFVTDPGYVAHYDAVAPGLGGWLYEVIAANAGAHGVDPESAVRE
ncbi:DNA-binding transcriptional regulator, MerR family [Streptomyces sp. MnatMP-M77]|uniref:MerR family transcriptional regulator n=1 Tax=unclassified Streptomyces TaxID=2593676 RepID=UPI000805A882|nr:MerR family transcriptional regulator [Streptomyces sp. MnatMP-M77]MYT77261.1 MerR family transcriptional regulator [Streptomyces sp. SID8364]SBU89785.1 DNA-binding transcriptional regulator, MerR family [Streptomyces sp. MnatMP-M77]